jgi:hypothetical protein
MIKHMHDLLFTGKYTLTLPSNVYPVMTTSKVSMSKSKTHIRLTDNTWISAIVIFLFIRKTNKYFIDLRIMSKTIKYNIMIAFNFCY